jgi:glycosyltransferase involved in cell wall biosynthesis
LTRIAVVIPALDEEGSIGLVLDALPCDVAPVVVVDNGSRDRTADVARAHGAVVIHEPRRGYGMACLAGLDLLRSHSQGPPDVVCFLDGDASDDPADLPRLVAPLLSGEADLVVGSRTRGGAQRGALLPQARFGNALATFLIRVLFGARFTDLGPFRAIRWSALEKLAMRDRGFGWTVEMQVKAARARLRHREVSVRYRRRHAGRSKVTGTIRGSVLAGATILATIARYACYSR